MNKILLLSLCLLIVFSSNTKNGDIFTVKEPAVEEPATSTNPSGKKIGENCLNHCDCLRGLSCEGKKCIPSKVNKLANC